MKKNRLSFIVLPNDPNNKVINFNLPRLFIPTLMIMTLLLLGTVSILFFHYYNKSEQLVIDNEILSTNLIEEQAKKEQLIAEVHDLRVKEERIHHQLDVLYELEYQVIETMKDLPVSVEPTGGIDLIFSDQVTQLLLDHSSSLSGKVSELIYRYNQTLDVLEKTNYELQFIPTTWPVKKNKITSKFGLRTDPFLKRTTFHTGIDIRGNTGEPVYATAKGEVIFANYSRGHGNYIIIKHSDQDETRYAHLSKVDVQVGDSVEKGEQIGAVGSTGRSTGPHLHYEIIENGDPVDPMHYLSIFDKIEEGE